MVGTAMTALGGAAQTAVAQTAGVDAPPVLRPPQGGRGIGDYSLHDFAARWMMQQDDLAELAHYAEANRTLPPEPDGRARIVMFGDSITAQWDLAPHDGDRIHFVNRGIGGQNSSQMLLRFEDDVVELAPDTVVILAGTNDLRAYVGDPSVVGPGALARVRRNVTAMTDIAQHRNIRVVLGLLPPVGADLERIARDPAAVRAINDWLRRFAADRHAAVADYHAALADETDAMPVRFSADGIHPNEAGHAAMWPALEHALAARR